MAHHRPTRAPASLLTSGLVALALLGGCAAATEAAPSPGGTPTTTAASPTSTPSVTPGPSQAPPAARDLETPDGEPVRVVVSSLAGEQLVDAKLVPAGLDDEGILAPPAGVAGWYDEKGWPRPGFPGASILAGHINTRRTGPDTFARLPEVRPGARVTVTYDSGDEVGFVVVRSKAVPKKETPRDDSIWDAGNPRPLLRLITCDPTTPVRGGHYVGNWVLWADAAPTGA
ncbi:class F sortase [Oryzobacter terrae]|uniref:class F sortase n=1 Tax=Oryzobacter terrae TaxID=1620385 RepID=UPI00366EECE7